MCSLDLLSMANLVNYFGKSPSIDDITLFPILLVKGTTKIAIYGLGNIRDERLYQTFKDRKVKLMRPREARDEWFNIFVIHQNRYTNTRLDSLCLPRVCQCCWLTHVIVLASSAAWHTARRTTFTK